LFSVAIDYRLTRDINSNAAMVGLRAEGRPDDTANVRLPDPETRCRANFSNWDDTAI